MSFSVVSRASETLRGLVGGVTWAPALTVAKSSILAFLSRIEKGTLLLVDEPGQTRRVFGQGLAPAKGDQLATGDSDVPRRADSTPRVELVVKNDAFWMRLFLFADMGFAEAYMLGEFDCQDLTSFFQVKSPPPCWRNEGC